MTDISEIKNFLACETPKAWIDAALQNQQLLLVDHAHCEKKAASTALTLLYRYVDRPELLHTMSRIAREELRHFEKVLAIMQQRNIEYIHLTPARYAETMRKQAKNHEPYKLVDILIIGAFIEARSCERFHKIAPLLDDELKDFYTSLLRSEARHFKDYLEFAEFYSPKPIAPRVDFFRHLEAELINSKDDEFRFHSGIVTM